MKNLDLPIKGTVCLDPVFGPFSTIFLKQNCIIMLGAKICFQIYQVHILSNFIKYVVTFTNDILTHFHYLYAAVLDAVLGRAGATLALRVLSSNFVFPFEVRVRLIS